MDILAEISEDALASQLERPKLKAAKSDPVKDLKAAENYLGESRSRLEAAEAHLGRQKAMLAQATEA
eukprot:12012642-Alexandrium_andersonii.AAC.1